MAFLRRDRLDHDAARQWYAAGGDLTECQRQGVTPFLRRGWQTTLARVDPKEPPTALYLSGAVGGLRKATCRQALLANVDEALMNVFTSVVGTNRTSRTYRRMSAIGSKADLSTVGTDVCL